MMKTNKRVILGLLWLCACLTINSFAAEQKKKSTKAEKTQQKPQEKSKAKIEESVLGMNVSGNKESPNVLYIVPWKGNTSAGKLPEISRLVDEVFAPVDPVVFAKQVKFYQQLTQQPETKSEEK